MNGRNSAIDCAKGIGIILVVFGHAASPVMTEGSALAKIYAGLYLFHMPLFFFLSGIVSMKLIEKTRGGGISLIKNRAERLLIPYCMWAVIYSCMKVVMKDQVRFEYTYSPWMFFVGNNPCGQMWFLYVLFVFSAIAIGFVNRNNYKKWCCVTLVVSFFSPLIPNELALPGISLSFSLYQVGFYFLGIALSGRKDNCFNNSKVFVSAGIVFVIYFLLGIRDNKWIWSLKAISAFCAIYVLMYICNNCAVINRNKYIQSLGQHSMSIYIFHAPILIIGRSFGFRFFRGHIVIYVLAITAITILLSLLAQRITKRVNLLQYLLLGEKGS